jgi:hypothetical protein
MVLPQRYNTDTQYHKLFLYYQAMIESAEILINQKDTRIVTPAGLIKLPVVNLRNWWVYLVDYRVIDGFPDFDKCILDLFFRLHFLNFRHIQSVGGIFITNAQKRLQSLYLGMQIQGLLVTNALFLVSVRDRMR